jgi:K+-sensing histidine kinase KdpD
MQRESNNTPKPDCTEPNLLGQVNEIAHKLRSHLTTIVIKAEMIDRVDSEKLSEPSRDYLRQIGQTSLQIADQIEQISRLTGELFAAPDLKRKIDKHHDSSNG